LQTGASADAERIKRKFVFTVLEIQREEEGHGESEWMGDLKK